MSTQIDENVVRVRDHYRKFWAMHGRDEKPPPLDPDGRPPIMNIGYWADGAQTSREAQIAFVRQLASRLGDLRGRRVLDVGCGVGGPASILALDYGAEVDGVNIVEEQVQLARGFMAAIGISERVRIHAANAMDLPFEDGSFDAVFSLEAAHCFVDKPRFLDQIRRVLRPGGRMAMADITAAVDAPLLRWQPAFNLDLVTADKWRWLMKDAGLDIVEHTLVGSAVYPGWRKSVARGTALRRRGILEHLSRNDAPGWQRQLRRAQAFKRSMMLSGRGGGTLPTASRSSPGFAKVSSR